MISNQIFPHSINTIPKANKQQTTGSETKHSKKKKGSVF